MESGMDERDQWIIQALQFDGRASFERIGRAVGLPAQTVARRYQRLRADRTVRVVGRSPYWAVGATPWLLRIQCTPDRADRIALALAERTATTWVRTSGGGEIVCGLRAGSPEEEENLLTRLDRTPRVVGFTAYCILHRFRAGRAPWRGWPAPLDPAAVALLTADQPPTPHPAAPDRAEPTGRGQPADPPQDSGRRRRPELTPVDLHILAELGVDGRTPVSDLAARVGVSESAVRRRLRALQEAGVLHFEVDFDPRAVGMRTEAMLWLTVPPSALAEVGDTLAGHPDVSFAAATSGPVPLAVSLLLPDLSAVYAHLTGTVGALPAVSRADTTIFARTWKRQGGPPLSGVPRRSPG
ncbi:Lrp/AsnC family transcriptional regulator [Plantactinospora sonchi]|uniref:Lrp/AsnC family transcriptional regulator n=1 Tax=Plantactinospora sonchi TaxID=1544735 RepID=A0ABU7RPI7_9ACTN